MKGFISSLSWILFLLAVGAGLLFYNFSYLPLASRAFRLEREVGMWTGRVDELADSLKLFKTQDTLFSVSYRFDELFVAPESLRLSTAGENILRTVVPQLGSGPVVEVIASCDRQLPKGAWQNSWEYSALAAAAVARRLVSLGVSADRVRVVALGDTRAPQRREAEAALLNRRIQIAVRPR